MKVLVCGSRTWTNALAIHDELARLPKDATIIHGGCKGADRMAAVEAADQGFAVEEYRAQWAIHGNAAGPIRNRLMLDQKPSLVLAFCRDLSKSKGTKDCVCEANRRGIPVVLLGAPR